MKKIIILAVILIGALLGIQLLNKKTDPRIAAINASRDFKVPDADNISRIFIAHRNGQTVDLTKKEGIWYIDDSVRVDPSVMTGIFDVAKNLELKYEPNEAMQKTALKTIAENGIMIEYFDSKGKKLKSYMMGSSTDGGHGNYAIIEGQEKPMVVKLRNAPSNLRLHFWKDRRNSWFDPTYISYRPDEISKITVDYTMRPDESFVLTKEGTGYELKPLNPTVKARTTDISPKIFESYLVNFERIGAESILGADHELRDSVAQTTPWCRVSIVNNSNKVQHLSFYPLMTDVEQEAIIQKRLHFSDISRYYVDEEGGNFYVSQMGVFEKILWGYTAFYDRAKSMK